MVAGHLHYVPDANYNGADSFTYKANDGSLDSAAATVNVTVNPVNDAPVAHDDTATTNEDNATTIDVTSNDSPGPADESSQVLSVKSDSISSPAHGTAELVTSGANAGQIRYTPAANYNGSDSFTYKVCDDGQGTPCSDDATVSLTVNAVNDAPVAHDDTATTDEDTAKTIDSSDLLANDTDVDGDNLHVASVSDATHGSVSLSGDASTVTFTPAADYNGAASFTYTVADGNGGTDTATVAVTVNAVNDAPTCSDVSLNTDEDTANDTSPDCGDIDSATLGYSIASQPAHGVASVVAGHLHYVPDANYNGADSFTYKANDGSLDSAAATV
ncbi:MAG: tandem-95 repeat protein, partial [Actinobacteria bacterium]|nr:tandem-95 repeat protein [Actinomycetota bacterium]